MQINEALLKSVTPKTWKDYDPVKLEHVKRIGSNPVDCSTLQKGDVLIVTESGYMDLVEVVANNVDSYEVCLAYHTSLGEIQPSPTPFIYDYKPGDATGKAMVGQWLRVFTLNEVPPRYLMQAEATGHFAV